MTTPEEFIKHYWESGQHGEDNRVKAALGQVQSKNIRDLLWSIDKHRMQVTEVSDQLGKNLKDVSENLGTTLKTITNDIIQSNADLAKSANKQAEWIKWLTFALVVFTALQVIAVFYK